MKKRILFIYRKKDLKNFNRELHTGWIQDCKDVFTIKMWGKGFGRTTKKSLLKKIAQFQPDYIYLTVRTRYRGWLPNLRKISVPKIFVECDTWRYHACDEWYKQFDKVYSRQPWLLFEK